MTTIETAKHTNAKYFVEWVNNNGESYYQLVRTKDVAILYANPELREVWAECFLCGISKSDVVLW